MPFAQRAQVDAPQQLVRFDIVGRALQQLPRRALGLARAAGAEVQVGQRMVQLRRSGVGVQRQLVLLDGARHQLRAALGDGLLFVAAGQRQVIVRLGAVRRRRGGVGGLAGSAAFAGAIWIGLATGALAGVPCAGAAVSGKDGTVLPGTIWTGVSGRRRAWPGAQRRLRRQRRARGAVN